MSAMDEGPEGVPGHGLDVRWDVDMDWIGGSRLKSALPSSGRSAHTDGGGLLLLHLRVILLLGDLLLRLRQPFGLRLRDVPRERVGCSGSTIGMPRAAT